MFLNVHVGSSSLSDEEIDSWADYCDRTDAGLLDEVMRSTGPAPSKWSVLPQSRPEAMPWDWKSPEMQADEILAFALGELD
jgi:hypothetical protein